jgi:tetratricopeptide (TPR) repeat protein
MPQKFFSCASLPPATISSVPIYDFAKANEVLENFPVENYYPCCGKSICSGCIYSFAVTGNKKCPYCNTDRRGTDEELLEKLMKRVAVNDVGAICQLAKHYEKVNGCFHQDHAKSMELFTRAANLGCSESQFCIGLKYDKAGDLKNAKFHYEAAAMAGHEMARFNLGVYEYNYGNIEQATKHWIIAASAGNYIAMHELRAFFEREGGNFYGKRIVSRESFDSTLEAYNISCVEMRSEARDVFIRVMLGGTNTSLGVEEEVH